MDELLGVFYNGLDPKRQMLTAVSCNMLESIKQLLEGKKIDVNVKLQVIIALLIPLSIIVFEDVPILVTIKLLILSSMLNKRYNAFTVFRNKMETQRCTFALKREAKNVCNI